MKKKVKIAIIALVVLLIVLLIVFGAIKNKESQANAGTNTVSEDEYIVSTKKITNYLDIMNGNYTMRYKTTITDSEGNETSTTVRYAQLGNKSMYDYEDALNTILTIGDTTYYIMHQTKTIAKYTNAQVSTERMTYSKATFEEFFIKTGTEKINDTEYYFEEYAVGDMADSSVRYYFNNEDKLTYIRLITVEGGYINEIIEMSSEVEEDLFEIPSGYKETDVSSMSSAE